MQIDLVNSTYAELVRSVRLVAGTMDQRDDVTQLVPSDGGDYVYALTAQQVNLMEWHYIATWPTSSLQSNMLQLTVV